MKITDELLVRVKKGDPSLFALVINSLIDYKSLKKLDFVVLTDALRASTCQLSDLAILWQSMSPEKSLQLLEAIDDNNSLTKLTLDIPLDEKGAKKLCDIIQKTKITKLSIKYENIPPGNFRTILKAIQKNKHLVDIEIQNVPVEEQATLFEILKSKSNLTRLSLGVSHKLVEDLVSKSIQECTPELYQSIASFLTSQTKLEEVSLGFNVFLNSKQIDDITHVCEHVSNLASFNFSYFMRDNKAFESLRQILLTKKKKLTETLDEHNPNYSIQRYFGLDKQAKWKLLKAVTIKTAIQKYDSNNPPSFNDIYQFIANRRNEIAWQQDYSDAHHPDDYSRIDKFGTLRSGENYLSYCTPNPGSRCESIFKELRNNFKNIDESYRNQIENYYNKENRASGATGLKGYYHGEEVEIKHGGIRYTTLVHGKKQPDEKQEAIFIHHAAPSKISLIMLQAEKAYVKLLTETDQNKALTQIAEIVWHVSHAMPNELGSAAIMEMLIEVLLEIKGFKKNHYTDKVPLDLIALLEPSLINFTNRFPKLFADQFEASALKTYSNIKKSDLLIETEKDDEDFKELLIKTKKELNHLKDVKSKRIQQVISNIQNAIDRLKYDYSLSPHRSAFLLYVVNKEKQRLKPKPQTLWPVNVFGPTPKAITAFKNIPMLKDENPKARDFYQTVLNKR